LIGELVGLYISKALLLDQPSTYSEINSFEQSCANTELDKTIDNNSNDFFIRYIFIGIRKYNLVEALPARPKASEWGEVKVNRVISFKIINIFHLYSI
jgi:hypothetical protein